MIIRVTTILAVIDLDSAGSLKINFDYGTYVMVLTVEQRERKRERKREGETMREREIYI